MGCYIEQYEQHGSDRAEYGTRLLDNISTKLIGSGMEGVAARSLRQYRQFFATYPEIRQTLSAKSSEVLIPSSIRQTLPLESPVSSPTREPISVERWDVFRKLSFSHFAELIAITDETKRLFYEVECIRGNWSVRELKRQNASLYYERSGLSTDKKKLAELTRSSAETADPRIAIRDPYVRRAVEDASWIRGVIAGRIPSRSSRLGPI